MSRWWGFVIALLSTLLVAAWLLASPGRSAPLAEDVPPVAMPASAALPERARPLALAPLLPAPAPAVASAPPSVVAATPCAHQSIEVRTAAAGVQRGCVSATQTRQAGSVRSYLVEAEGVSPWRLIVDLVGERVMSVRLRRGALGIAPEALYVCETSSCGQVALGSPDAAGVRKLSLDAVALSALPRGQRWTPQIPVSESVAASQAEASTASSPAASGPAAAQPEVAHVTAALEVPPDRPSSSLACAGGDLHLALAGGGTSAFCPSGGAGFELAEDGQLRFSFRDLDGRSLVVALDADRAIASVSLGPLSCSAPNCAGVVMSLQGDAGDPEVERHFSFAGTTLTDKRQRLPAATLSGTVTMPSQQQ